MNRLAAIIMIIYILIVGSVGAETFNENNTLTLDKAIEIAIANNTLIREAIENQKASVEEEKSAKADFFPKLSASYSYTRLKETPFAIFKSPAGPTFGSATVDVGDKDRFHWDVTVTQPIFTGFALSTKHKMARLGVDIKSMERKRAVLDVVKQVKVSYFNILLAKKFLIVTEEAVKHLESHVNDAEKFYEQGMIPYNDLLRSKVALADARQKRVRAESNLEIARSALNKVLRIGINKKTGVQDIPDIEPTSLRLDLDYLIEEAMRSRPELKALRIALKNAGYSIKLARSSYYPEVSLVGSYEQNGENLRASKNRFSNSYNANVMLQFKWTFFEWGKKRAEAKKCYFDKLALIEKVKGTEDAVKLEVKDALLDLRVAEKNIHTAEESLDQAKENYRITNLQYQQQITTSTEVLDARTFLTQAETNYYSALYDYMISGAELERAIGGSWEENQGVKG